MFPERQPMRSGDLRPEFFDVVEPCGATLPFFVRRIVRLWVRLKATTGESQ